jgi:hypothetical protein
MAPRTALSGSGAIEHLRWEAVTTQELSQPIDRGKDVLE